jgi:hypothetical protein
MPRRLTLFDKLFSATFAFLICLILLLPGGQPLTTTRLVLRLIYSLAAYLLALYVDTDVEDYAQQVPGSADTVNYQFAKIVCVLFGIFSLGLIDWSGLATWEIKQ